MAQIRLRDYKEPLTSFDHNIINLGVHKPGRFTGFDLMVSTAALTFDLQHSAPGIVYKDPANNPIGPVGVYMTVQGGIIVETTPITGFVIDSNSGNTKDRIDLIVSNHQYISLAGGQNATYSIIKGPINDFSEPPLTNSDYQVVLAKLVIPAGAVDLTNVQLIKSKSPDSGDGEDARLHEVNKYTAYNQFKFSSTDYDASDPSHNISLAGLKSGWELSSDGNRFNLFHPTSLDFNVDAIRVGKEFSQDGAKITLRIGTNGTIRDNQPIDVGSIALGFDPIIIPSQFANTVLVVSSVETLGIKVPLGEVWLVDLVRHLGKWVVVSVSGQSYSYFKGGMVIEADLTSDEIAKNFLNNGLGKNLYSGFQICNGLNGTQDRRCRFSIMASEVPNSGAPALASDLLAYAMLSTTSTALTGSLSGVVKRILSVNNIPEHFHFISTVPQGNGFQTGLTLTSSRFLAGSADTGQTNAYIFQGSTVAPTVGRTSSVGLAAPEGVVTLPPFIATLKLMKLKV